MKHLCSAAALLLATTACTTAMPPQAVAPAPAVAATPPAAAQPAIDPAAEEQRLMAFLDAAFEEQLARSPESLTALGRKEAYDRLDIYTDAYRQQGLELSQRQLAALRAQFRPENLSPAGRLSYRLFEEEIEREISAYQWRWHGFPASTNGSPAGQIPIFLINQHRIASAADARGLHRATDRGRARDERNNREHAPTGVDGHRALALQLRAGPRRCPAGACGGALCRRRRHAGIRRLQVESGQARHSPRRDKDALIAEARAALTGPFERGYRNFMATWDALEPQSQGNRGAWSLPNGGAFYANRLSQSTTTDLSADQIHQVGLQQVAGIHGEMERIKTQVGFKGTLQDFFRHIIAGQQYKYPNTAAGRQQYLTDAKRYIAQVMTAAPQWFRRLPKAPLDVRAVEEWRQETAPVAFYNRPSEDGSRPGIYYVNLADMNQVLKPQTEAISYHEGAPGHHFQIALAQELPNVPKFRRFGGYGAYSEGWGLYSEGLGKEMGFYEDPYSEFGMLSTQLWRAVRLVTDTGIHSKQWTREQAIAYFLRNALLSERDATKEVERYFNWPGQATSYMIGQLKILELRDRARQSLGPRFDIRDFHAVILENGAVPLNVLEELVNAYNASGGSAAGNVPQPVPASGPGERGN